MPDLCPICNSTLKDEARFIGRKTIKSFSCSNCGDFTLSYDVITQLPSLFESDKEAKVKIGYAIRMMQKTGGFPEIYAKTISEILKRPLPGPREQADLLIRWLGENIGGPGESVIVRSDTHGSIIGAKSYDGFRFVVQYLHSEGLVLGDFGSIIPENYYRANITLSFKGWSYYEQLRHGRVSYRKAFMAMKFDVPTLETIFESVFKPYVKQTGFELFCLKDIPVAGLIDNRLRVEIQACDFLIADLTHKNPGAYFEAGYAEGLGKPVIYTCNKEKFKLLKTHFDTNHHLTIMWEESSPQTAGEELKACIRATLPHLAKQEDE